MSKHSQSTPHFPLYTHFTFPTKHSLHNSHLLLGQVKKQLEMVNKSIVWIPRSAEETTSQYSVTEIYFAAYKPQNQYSAEPSGPTTKMTNHWQIFLRWGPANSVGLDPSPNYPNMDMTLSCVAKNYAHTMNAHKLVCLTPMKPITVGGIVELLKQNKYDKYNFTSHGTGCRYWVYSVVQLLAKSGVIDGPSANEAATAIDIAWIDHKPQEAVHQTSLHEHQGVFVG